MTNISFLLFFLPVSLLVYWKLLRSLRAKNIFLLLLNVLFYASIQIEYLPLILFLTFSTYFLGKKRKFSAGILINLLALVVFKLFSVQISNLLQTVFSLRGTGNFFIPGIPLGLSFVIFKHIGYLIEMKKGKNSSPGSFLLFANFSLFFPQIAAGPLSDFSDTGKQLRQISQKINYSQIYSSLFRISRGLGKKLLISDPISTWLNDPANSILNLEGMSAAWLVVAAFGIQIYFDFSAYSDIAIAVAQLFGIRLPENFRNPYLALNYRQFWERWHISLSQWFRVYVFSPLSRSLIIFLDRKNRFWAQFFSSIATMALVGIWHGNAIGFLLWGIYHGILLIALPPQIASKIKLPIILQRSLFLVSILLGWAIFMSPNIESLVHFMSQLFGAEGIGNIRIFARFFGNPVGLSFAMGVLLSIFGISDQAVFFPTNKRKRKLAAVFNGVFIALSIFLLNSSNIDFIYAQF